MAQNGKMFLKNGLVGVGVVSLTPVVQNFLQGIAGTNFLTQTFQVSVFPLSLVGFVSAGVIVHLLMMAFDRVKYFK